MLPLAVKLAGLPVLVIGAGVVGARKAAQLLAAGAEVSVISSSVSAPLPEGIGALHRRPFRPGDLRGFHLVVSAVGSDDVNDLIVNEATRERVWLNVVDDPERSNFYFMALHRAGEVTVAVGTDGASPALAREVRSLVASSLPPHLGEVAATLRSERRTIHERGQTTEGLDWRSRIRELLDATSLDGAAPGGAS